jgi:hypothetical protein
MKTIRLLLLHICKQALRILLTAGGIMIINFIKYRNIRIQYLKRMKLQLIILIKNLFTIMRKAKDLHIKTIWNYYNKILILIIRMN